MKRHLWVQGGEPPERLPAALNRLLEDSEGWESWCTALDVLAELCRLGLGSGFTWVHGSIADKDGSRIDASWLEWW